MCKLVIIPGINNDTRLKALAFLQKIAPHVSSCNSDGLGYAALDNKGKLFGERWHTNANAFNSKYWDDQKKKAVAELPPPTSNHLFAGALEPKASTSSTPNYYNKGNGDAYNHFGDVNLDGITCITLHTRMATSGKEFKNTHPFVRGGTSLIHNGVIYNVGELEQISSTCDSECILNEYYTQGVSKDFKRIQNVADNLSGYYACGVISDASEGRTPTLDIFKDTGSRLSSMFVEELGGYVFTTDGDDAVKVCKELGWKAPKEYSFKAGFLLRLDGITGQHIDTFKFDPKGKTRSYAGSHSGSYSSGHNYNVCGYDDNNYSRSSSRKADKFNRFGRANGKTTRLSDTPDVWLENDKGQWRMSHE